MSSPIRLDLEIALQDLLVAIEDLPKQARSVRDVVTLETTARSLLHALNVAERATVALQDLLVAIEDLPKQARSVRDVVTLETTARSLLHALNVAERATVDHPPYLGS